MEICSNNCSICPIRLACYLNSIDSLDNDEDKDEEDDDNEEYDS